LVETNIRLRILQKGSESRNDTALCWDRASGGEIVSRRAHRGQVGSCRTILFCGGFQPRRSGNHLSGRAKEPINEGGAQLCGWYVLLQKAQRREWLQPGLLFDQDNRRNPQGPGREIRDSESEMPHHPRPTITPSWSGGESELEIDQPMRSCMKWRWIERCVRLFAH